MTFDKIKALIADQLDIDEDSIKETSSFTDDFNIDSLEVVDLIMRVEEEFGIEIPEDQSENFKTVGDFVTFIEEKQ